MLSDTNTPEVENGLVKSGWGCKGCHKRPVLDDVIVMDAGAGVRRCLERMSMTVDNDGSGGKKF